MPALLDRETQFRNSNSQKELPWWKLPATGFNVEGEIDCLLRMQQESLQKGDSPQDSLKSALNETKGNIIGYKFEYIMQRLLLPNPVTLAKVNGRLRLANSLSLQPLVEITTEQERYGAVKRAIQLVEDHLTTEDGESKMAVIQSPDNWSGLTSADGKEIVYPDSQTYMFKKNTDGSLEAFTVVTDMGFEENRHFLSKLGKDKDKVGVGTTQKEKLANVVESVVLLSGKETDIGFSGIVDKIRETRREVMNSDVARTIKHGGGETEDKSFDEIYRDLKNERLIDSDKYAEAAMTEFENYCNAAFGSGKPVNRDELEKRLALTIVNISYAVKGKPALDYDEVFATQSGNFVTAEKKLFMKELAYIKTLGGCNGGGVSSGGTGVINTGLGTRLFSTTESNSSGTKHCGNCDQDKKAEKFGACGYCTDCFPE